MKLSDFDFDYPRELIAKYPLGKRDDSRLLVVDRKKNNFVETKFSGILDYIAPNDALILNDTRVRKSRLFGKKVTGGVVEVLIVEEYESELFGALISPPRGIKIGSKISFKKGLKCIVTDNTGSIKKIKFIKPGESDKLEDIIESIGEVPLPPYIKRPAEELDEARYQTVYANVGNASAAPTAGLHFTESLLKAALDRKINIGFVTLDVGFGTFSPIKEEEDFRKHKMHKEHFKLSKETADIVNRTKLNKYKVFAVGTTSLRVLESCVNDSGMVEAKESDTEIFIYPPYEFKVVDALLTNFHFPKSTLMLLVSAFCGHRLIMEAYKYAIANKFRLFSYGDAMLIL